MSKIIGSVGGYESDEAVAALDWRTWTKSLKNMSEMLNAKSNATWEKPESDKKPEPDKNEPDKNDEEDDEEDEEKDGDEWEGILTAFSNRKLHLNCRLLVAVRMRGRTCLRGTIQRVTSHAF